MKKVISILLTVTVIAVGVVFMTIKNKPSITVISPTKDDVITPGSDVEIKWATKNIPDTYKVPVAIRRIPPPPLQEEGQEFDPVIFTNLENSGVANWTVSNMYPAGNYVFTLNVYESLPITDPVSKESDIFKIAEMTIGGQKDEGGCLIGAGYSWCEAKQICIRSFEKYCTKATPKAFVFKCDDSKSINATFYPTDDKFVDLVLSGEDEMRISLPRAISASGARYAKADESIVFWNKGDTAFVTEGTPAEETYSNCVLK